LWDPPTQNKHKLEIADSKTYMYTPHSKESIFVTKYSFREIESRYEVCANKTYLASITALSSSYVFPQMST
jgi:hypothetical protein